MSDDFKFDANNSTIKDLLFKSPSIEMRIPRFQRAYTWDEDNISEFWSDLVGTPDSYLLGSIILNYENEKNEGWVEIIDGQQRLLTITLFVAVIRDLMKDIDDSIAHRFQTQCITVEGWDGKETIRIRCGDSIREFFETHVQNFNGDLRNAPATTIEEKRIKKNYEFLYEKVANGLQGRETVKEKIAYLEDIRDRVAGLIIIHIQIYREEDAYEIFETTNARGVDLNVADLLKNMIFKNIMPKGSKDSAKDDWERLVSNVDATGFELRRFLRYFWISRYEFVQEKRLYRQIKLSTNDWKRLLEDLISDSELFWLLLEGTSEDWEERFPKVGHKFHRSLSAIKYMNVSQCYVFFLALFRNYDLIGINQIQVVNDIENFTFLYSAISKQPGNRVERIYSRYAKELEELCQELTGEKLQGKVNSLTGRLKNELREEKPLLDTFLQKWMDLKYRQSTQARSFLKYILERINSEMESSREKKIDFNIVNIEHFVPQNPGKAWGVGIEDVKDYVNLLGNLTLVDKKFNSAAGNKGPKEKVEELSKSTLAITKEFLEKIAENANKWGANEILNRQEELGKIGYNKIWKL